MDKEILITRILRPVVKALVKLGCNFNVVKSILLKEFVHQAKNEVGNNACGISAKTGLDRRLVGSILKDDLVYLPSNGIDLIARKLSELNETTVLTNEVLKDVIKSEANGRYTFDTVKNELISTKRISTDGDIIIFHSTDLKGMLSRDKYSHLLGDSIDICNETLLHLMHGRDLFHFKNYSNQIPPENSKEATIALFNQAKEHKIQKHNLLESFETTEERIYPAIGFLQVQLDEYLTKEQE